MPQDTSPPVGNSYFWESINHISYPRHWCAFSCRGTGSEWGRFRFQAVLLHMQSVRAGLGTGHVGSAPSRFPSRLGLWRWVLEGDLHTPGWLFRGGKVASWICGEAGWP